MRLFVGIPIPLAAAEEISRVLAVLQPLAPRMRWSAPELHHVTLQFLGQTRPEQYACTVDRLRAIQSPAIQVSMGEVGVFSRARVLFVGVAPTDALLRLQKSVTERNRACGFVPEDRPFHPHITLARGREDLAGLQPSLSSVPPCLCTFTADEFLLYRSDPSKAGSKYTVLDRFRLNSDSTSTQVSPAPLR